MFRNALALCASLLLALAPLSGKATAQPSAAKPTPAQTQPSAKSQENEKAVKLESPLPAPTGPELQIRFPDGGSVSCPLKIVHTNILLVFSESRLIDTPSQACLKIVETLERQQNISELRALLTHMQGRSRDKYEEALSDFLLGRLGISRTTIATIHLDLNHDFDQWSDQEIIKYLNEKYDSYTIHLRRINEIRRRRPGALR